MTSAERAKLLFTARLLGAARTIDWLSTGLTLAAVWHSAYISALFGIIAKYYAFRVALDAKLFDDLANDRLAVADLDAALGRTGNREWPDRIRGARQLLVLLTIATVAQAAALAWRLR
jgi:hypothetical protein